MYCTCTLPTHATCDTIVIVFGSKVKRVFAFVVTGTGLCCVAPQHSTHNRQMSGRRKDRDRSRRRDRDRTPMAPSSSAAFYPQQQGYMAHQPPSPPPPPGYYPPQGFMAPHPTGFYPPIAAPSHTSDGGSQDGADDSSMSKTSGSDDDSSRSRAKGVGRRRKPKGKDKDSRKQKKLKSQDSDNEKADFPGSTYRYLGGKDLAGTTPDRAKCCYPKRWKVLMLQRIHPGKMNQSRPLGL